MKKLTTGLGTFLFIALSTGIALAQDKTTGGGVGGPFGIVIGYMRVAFNWIRPFVFPDTEWDYWWIILFTIPLTLAWMALASAGVKKFFNDMGGIIVYGLLALAVLLGFVGPFLGAVAVIIGVVTNLIGLSLNLSIRGIFNLVKTLLKLIPFFLVVWIITKIPGLQGLIERWINLGKDIAGRIWRQHEVVKNNPKTVWAVVGGLAMALVINGKFLMHLTADFAFPGLIPAVSAATGVFFLIFRTLPGQKLVMKGRLKVTKAPDPKSGDWSCPNWSKEWLLDSKGRQVPDPAHPGKDKFRAIRCGHINHRTAPECMSTVCHYPNPDWILKCEGCGFKGDESMGFRRLKRGEHQKCQKCGHSHAPPPKRMGFHDPGQATYNASTPGAVAAVAQVAPSAAAVRKAPAPVVVPSMGLPVSCSGCGKQYDAGLGYTRCPHCGKPFASPPGRLVSAPQTAPVPPAPPLSPAQLIQNELAEIRATGRKSWKR